MKGLNTKNLTIKKSDIAGNGFFTSNEFKRGQSIHVLDGELCSLDEIIKRVKEGKEESSDPLAVFE